MNCEFCHTDVDADDYQSHMEQHRIRQAFVKLHSKWLVAEHRSSMNVEMDNLAIELGLNPNHVSVDEIFNCTPTKSLQNSEKTMANQEYISSEQAKGRMACVTPIPVSAYPKSETWRETHALIYAGDTYIARAFTSKEAQTICDAHNQSLAVHVNHDSTTQE